MMTQLPDGVQLLRTLTGHDGRIGRIGWSPDGRQLATPSMDGTVRIWDAGSGVCLRTIRGHRGGVLVAAFDPAGRILATGGNDATKLWDVDSGELRTTLDTGDCRSVAFDPHNRILATANGSSEVTLWEFATGAVRYRLTVHTKFVSGVAFDAEGGTLATGSADSTIILWKVPGGRPFRTLAGHSDDVNGIALHPAGEILASASSDHSVRLWDLARGRTVAILEGHTGPVRSLSFSHDGRVLASKSGDGTVRLWDSQSGRCRAVLPALRSRYWAPSVAFHPHLPILAVVGSGAARSSARDSSVVQLWELDVDRLLVHTATSSVSYTTAKIVLVGEAGVGKTGLGWRLAHGEFVEHASTHGQQFWLLDELGGAGADGTECDAILWDLAGQPDYRLIHALYLDDADLALVLFDPTRGDDPLRGAEYWLHQLGRDRPIILVAARSHRGSPRLTTEEIEVFCAERGIRGYVATSALQGDGLDELVERMRTAIRWDELPTTVTTQTFKRIKDDMLELKEAPGGEETILSLAELRARLEQEHPATEFPEDELLAAVRHLSNHGYVAQLRTSRDELRILLAPVLLNNLAASMVLEARRNPRGLGSLEEQQVLSGGTTSRSLRGCRLMRERSCSTRPSRCSWRTRSVSVRPTRSAGIPI